MLLFANDENARSALNAGGLSNVAMSIVRYQPKSVSNRF